MTFGIHLVEGNWMHNTYKTHEGLANNKSDAINSLESHEGEEIECDAFRNALDENQNAFKNNNEEATTTNQNNEQREEHTGRQKYEKNNADHIKMHDLSIRTHSHATHEANEPHLYDDGVDANHHGFVPVNQPGNSFLFTRVLGRRHMEHEMEWKEVPKCWVCCEASEYLFQAKSLGELGISQLGGNGDLSKWWLSIEVHYFDSSGMPRIGRHTPVVPGNENEMGFQHYAMVSFFSFSTSLFIDRNFYKSNYIIIANRRLTYIHIYIFNIVYTPVLYYYTY